MTVVVLSVAAFTGLTAAEWCRCRPPRPDPGPPPVLPIGWSLEQLAGRRPLRRVDLPVRDLPTPAALIPDRLERWQIARARHHQIGATP